MRAIVYAIKHADKRYWPLSLSLSVFTIVSNFGCRSHLHGGLVKYAQKLDQKTGSLFDEVLFELATRPRGQTPLCYQWKQPVESSGVLECLIEENWDTSCTQAECP